ncbi:hypothetical protein Q5P01_004979 [Channa striata]|uniref:Uncharacterized protein n=1 Tax=Channa striata TaxID=64152 RepID=A0AA88NC33_CHASR|nr:hypothetical protein Q5P01_004979 [Channa striata]
MLWFIQPRSGSDVDKVRLALSTSLNANYNSISLLLTCPGAGQTLLWCERSVRGRVRPLAKGHCAGKGPLGARTEASTLEVKGYKDRLKEQEGANRSSGCPPLHLKGTQSL